MTIEDTGQPHDGEATGLEAFLRSAREAAESGSPRRVTKRKLMRQMGAKRRGAWNLRQMQKALDAFGLTTDPHFSTGYIDDYTTIDLAPVPVEDPSDAVAEEEEDEAIERSTGLTVGQLPSATAGLCHVEVYDDLRRVRSLMLQHDYSQLAVLGEGGELRGAVSWESIALATLLVNEPTLADATIRATVVDTDEDLLHLLPVVNERGFVIVRNKEGRLTGLVTTADLGQLFADLAHPYFLLGEIEHRLRAALERRWSIEELFPTGARGRAIASFDDLTLGEILYLLRADDRWRELGWPFDQGVFTNSLDAVRRIRNDVMHFRPDPISAEDLRTLQNFRKWLRLSQNHASAPLGS